MFVADIHREHRSRNSRALRRYARALTRDVVDGRRSRPGLSGPRAGQTASLAGGNRSAGLAVHDPAQSICQPRPPRGPRGDGGRVQRNRAAADPRAAPGQSAWSCAISNARSPSCRRSSASVILLVGLEGMRYEEVADVLGVPVGTVRSRLSRGREALRRLMGFEADDEVQIAAGGHGQIVSRDASGTIREAPRWQ